MIDHQNTILVIASRMAARNLPGKPMVDVAGSPLIVRVWRAAMASKLGHVLVAAAEAEIANAVIAAGGDAIVAGATVASGPDRIAAALALRDERKAYEHVVCLSDDILGLETLDIQRALAGLTNPGVDISTIATELSQATEATDASQPPVKIIAPLSDAREAAFVRDMFRTVPAGLDLPAWQHVAVTAFRRDALDRFASLPKSARETERTIDLMRALDHGMKMAVVRVDHQPLQVDTLARLEAARRMMKDKT